MLRLGIRDLCWLILVAALAVGWWRDRYIIWEAESLYWKADRDAYRQQPMVLTWDPGVTAIPKFDRQLITPGWHTWSDTAIYAIGLDEQVRHSGNKGAFIKKRDVGKPSTASMDQAFRADSYRGKRLRLSGYIKTQDVDLASLWMQVEGTTTGARDDMEDRPVTGTTEWTLRDIVMDVPHDSINIAFGVALRGNGQAWFDDLRFEVVGDDVPTTIQIARLEVGQLPAKVHPDLPAEPINLDFEK